VKCTKRMVSAVVGAIAATVALSGMAAVVAVLGYLKREQWTRPAYRWVRGVSCAPIRFARMVRLGHALDD
jgi:hypothetical protein